MHRTALTRSLSGDFITLRLGALNRIPALPLVFVASLLLAPQAASAITIATVPVNGSNSNDPSTGGLYGGIEGFGPFYYRGPSYRIGRTEVTVGQYTAFLNAVAATDTYGLYNPLMGTDLNIAGIARNGPGNSYHYAVIGSANKPVTYVSWGDAARFCNWLDNGQPGLGGPAVPQNEASTEFGAYPLYLYGNTNEGLANVGWITYPVSHWFLPTEDEWYKAAYHQPAAQGGDADDYWAYPTGTNFAPNSDQPPGEISIQGNVANFYRSDGPANGINDGYAVTGSTIYSSSQNYLTDAGAYKQAGSFYGTRDQGGNVSEWNETMINNAGVHTFRGIRGGSWGDGSGLLSSSGRDFALPLTENSSLGFRVAYHPIPGDVNFDGFVNIFDINLVSAHWGEMGPDGDANGDMMVDIFDINLISANWTPPPALAGSAAVPEPSSAFLAISALSGLVGGIYRSRRDRAQ